MSGNEPFLNPNPKPPKFRRLLLLSLTALLAAAPRGLAAGRESEERITLIDPLQVSVIGYRLPVSREKLSDMPSNTTIKSREDLELVHPLTFQEAVRDAEGLAFYDQSGNALDTTMALRGFSDTSAITFLEDGVRVNEVDGSSVNLPLLRMMDMESVQIERGSASPVYGSNSFAGVVNLTTRRPSLRPLSVFGGIRFHQGVSGTLEDKISPWGGRWTYFFDGGRDVTDGFRENGESRITSFDVKAGYELPDGEGGLRVGVLHNAEALSNPAELTFDQFQFDRERSNKPLDGRKFKNTIVHVDADKKFWDDHLTASVLGSWRFLASKFFTTSGTFTDFTFGFDPDTNLVLDRSSEKDLTWLVKYEDSWRRVDNESQLGMEYRHELDHSLQREAFGGAIVERLPADTDRIAHPDNLALFWREQLRFFDKVIPFFGMRHDFYGLRTDDAVNPGQNISRRWTQSTLATGMTVKPAETIDLFGNYSQGFRVPTISELAPFAGTISTTLQPENSDSVELGTRLHYKNLAALKASYFIIDLKNEIVFDSTSIGPLAPFGQNINIGKSRRYGIELRQDANPVPELSLYGAYTYTRATVRETDAGGSLVDGRALGQIPENVFGLGGFAKPFARLGEPFDGLRLGLTGLFTGRQHPQSFESAAQGTLNRTGGAGHFIKSYSVWNFIVAYAWRKKEIYFKINNLFDERYYSRAINATSFGTSIYPAGTYTFVTPAPPREYVLGASYEF